MKNLHSTVPPNITVILPAYNEEVSIGSVVLRTKKYSRRVVVVDAASSDHTVDVAEMAGAEVIRNHVNRGKEISLKNVVETASDSDIIVIMNIGVCHDPGLIPRMIAPIREGTFEFSVGICFSKLKEAQKTCFYSTTKVRSPNPLVTLLFQKNAFQKWIFLRFPFSPCVPS